MKMYDLVIENADILTMNGVFSCGIDEEQLYHQAMGMTTGGDIRELHSPQYYAQDSVIPYAAELYAACAPGNSE